MQRGLSVTPSRSTPATPLVASLDINGAGIGSTRPWHVLTQLVLIANATQDEPPQRQSSFTA
ncbi:hypothetical protein [Burkholderia ambifaria]|uniref:hypothetical protein n=1 Tax=Burkholderia ambifaria TaxID=152480 RepID=UPI0002D75B25|nr:hypothetical protein [Burkholderia ambifaria]